jgi:hypothetical protein
MGRVNLGMPVTRRADVLHGLLTADREVCCDIDLAGKAQLSGNRWQRSDADTNSSKYNGLRQL